MSEATPVFLLVNVVGRMLNKKLEFGVAIFKIPYGI